MGSKMGAEVGDKVRRRVGAQNKEATYGAQGRGAEQGGKVWRAGFGGQGISDRVGDARSKAQGPG